MHVYWDKYFSLTTSPLAATFTDEQAVGDLEAVSPSITQLVTESEFTLKCI